MFRESLADDAWMLFVFETPSPRSFWMKNTLIPLDIVWIDEDYTVIGVTTAEPCDVTPWQQCPSYPSPGDVLYVLEVNAGSFDGKIWDSVDIVFLEDRWGGND